MEKKSFTQPTLLLEAQRNNFITHVAQSIFVRDKVCLKLLDTPCFIVGVHCSKGDILPVYAFMLHNGIQVICSYNYYDWAVVIRNICSSNLEYPDDLVYDFWNPEECSYQGMKQEWMSYGNSFKVKDDYDLYALMRYLNSFSTAWVCPDFSRTPAKEFIDRISKRHPSLTTLSYLFETTVKKFEMQHLPYGTVESFISGLNSNIAPTYHGKTLATTKRTFYFEVACHLWAYGLQEKVEPKYKKGDIVYVKRRTTENLIRFVTINGVSLVDDDTKVVYYDEDGDPWHEELFEGKVNGNIELEALYADYKNYLKLKEKFSKGIVWEKK